MKLESGVIVATRYRLDRCLGEGGMGTVWAVTHQITQRRHALKFVKTSGGRTDLHRRFLREARAASAVDHPNLVRVHDVFELEDGTPVMVMDLLEGETLGARLRREKVLSLQEVASVMVPVISAVGTAHAAGIVHRDLKPENIFLQAQADGPPRIRVLDFGIAKLTPTADVTDTATITETGTLLGTPVYMSPEQSFGERTVDHRTDIWALGVILYEALSGVRPVEGENLGQIIKQLLGKRIVPLESVRPDLPAAVTDLVARMLKDDREKRLSDLREAVAVLQSHTAVQAPAFGDPAAALEREPELASSPRVVVPGTANEHGDTEQVPSNSVDVTQGPTFVSIAQRRTPRARYVMLGVVAAVAIASFVFWASHDGNPAPQPSLAATSTTVASHPMPMPERPAAPHPEAKLPPPQAELREDVAAKEPPAVPPPSHDGAAAATRRAASSKSPPKARTVKATADMARAPTVAPTSTAPQKDNPGPGLVDEPPF